MPSPTPAEQIEQERLRALRRYALLDTPPEPAFDRLTRLACRLFDVPVAIVSLVDEGRQWFKARKGLDFRETPRAGSFCTHNVERGAVMVVEDAATDARFDDSPLVHGPGPHLRFYAGAPLTTYDGHHLGAFCVLDRAPRAFSEEDEASLTDFAEQAMEEIELRRHLPEGGEALCRNKALFSALVGVEHEIAGGPHRRLEDVLDLIVRRAAGLTEADGAVVELPEAGALVCRGVTGMAEAHAGLRVDATESLSARCLRRNRVLHCADTEADTRIDRAACRRMGVRSMVAAPLGSDEQPVGVLKVLARAPGRFEAQDGQVLRWLARLAAAAVKRAQAEQVLNERTRRYRTLIEQTAEAIYFAELDGGRVIETNSAFRELTGYGEEAVARGLHIADFVMHAPEDIEQLMGEVRREGRITRERRWCNVGGRVFDMQLTVGLLHPEQGRSPILAVVGRDITERRRAEDALRQSEERHRSLLEHLPVGVYRSTPDGRILEANEAMVSLLGYESIDALREVRIQDLYVDREARERHTRRLAQRQQESAEFALRRADGTVLRVYDYPRVVRDEDGEVVHYDGIIVDVTERRRAEEQLAQSEARLRAIVENVSDIIEIVDEDGIVQHISGDVEGITGYTREQVVGRPHFLNAHEDDREHVKDELAYLLTHAGETVEFEYRFQHRDGTWRHLSVRGRNFQGGLASGAFLGVVRDMTERRRAEQQLAESEERLRAIIENVADVIEVIDAGGILRYASRAIEDLTGFEPEALEGESVFARMHPDDRPAAERKVQALLDRSSDAVELEYRFRHRDGTWRYISAHVRNMLGSPGINGLLSTAREVTEKKQFEEELVAAKEEAEEMARVKTVFLTNMSHEIRTPLASILGFAEVIIEEADGQMREFAELIQHGGKRLSETLDSVLDLARLEAGGFEPNLEAVAARPVLEEAAELYAPMARKKGLAFELDLPPDDLSFRADRAGVGRMLANLLSNAIKFTDEGSITLAGRRARGRRVELVVSDTGAGISEEFRAHLFEAFRQESSGLARLHEGAGLGLTITHRLASVMGAEVKVESALGKGSTFALCFRARAASAATAPRLPDEPLPDFGADLGRLLVVEDNHDTRQLLEYLLRTAWTPTVVADPESAFQAAAATDFDAVLMDINLGTDLNGVDVMQRLRRDERYAHAPFVALTAYAMPGDAKRFEEAGFDAYLAKPIGREDLLRVLQRTTAARPNGAGEPDDEGDA